jgi:hypothetical protein
MKKLLFIAAAFTIAATSFSQTEKKTETKTSEVKKEVKAAAPKAKAAGKREVKTIEQKGIPTIPAEKIAQPMKLEDEKSAAQITPVQAAPPVELADASKAFEFKNDAFDFGKIPAGKPSKYDLFIKNVSKETQELTLVQPGCGCTTPEYEQNKKFAPGETVKVTLGFNGGAPGSGQTFSKSVTVTLKGFKPKVVTFRGETFAVPTESAPANGAIDKLKPAEETKH